MREKMEDPNNFANIINAAKDLKNGFEDLSNSIAYAFKPYFEPFLVFWKHLTWNSRKKKASKYEIAERKKEKKNKMLMSRNRHYFLTHGKHGLRRPN
jgi:hypothetical protein